MFAAAALAMTAGAAAAQNIGGRYQVQGSNFDGSSYSGVAEITVTSNNTCRIVWQTGSTSSRGICMRNNNAFSASYQLGNSIGLIIYEMMPDGTMRGLWTIADRAGVGRETLTPIK
jgi:hypothetical protein